MERFASVGLKQVTLLLNSMGDADTRKQYQQSLRDFLEEHTLDLDEEDRSKVQSHPLQSSGL